MQKGIIRVVVIAVFTLLLLGATSHLAVAESRSAAGNSGEKKVSRIPFNGKVGAVDKAAQTITLEGKQRQRVIHVTPDTKIMKAGQPATLDDASVGEVVGGQLTKTADGREEAVSIRIGAKPEPAPKKKKKSDGN